MTVSGVSRASERPEAGDARERSLARRDSDKFEALVLQRRKRRSGAAGHGDEGDGVKGDPGDPGAAMAVLLATLGGSLPRPVSPTSRDGAVAGSALFFEKLEEAGGVPRAVDVVSLGNGSGRELGLRVASGPFVGLEVRASMQLSTVAVTLIPSSRAQQKRLQAATSRLTAALSDGMGMDIRMEVRDATR